MCYSGKCPLEDRSGNCIAKDPVPKCPNSITEEEFHQGESNESIS